MKFLEKTVKIPDQTDWDVTLKFPNGKELLIQGRISNADKGYNGSLDIILPEDQDVTCFEGDNMTPAKAKYNCLFTKQLMMELPYNEER